jgi:hypothetical protein
MIGEADELATFTYRFYSRLDDWKRGKYHYPQLCPKDWECSVAQKSQIGPCRSQKKIHEVKIEIDSPKVFYQPHHAKSLKSMKLVQSQK